MFEYLFSQQGLSIERLRSLVEVHAAGGISKAAPKNGVRQTLIGRQIHELESFFELKLTSKKGKVIELNEAGIDLATQAKAALGLLEDFKRKQIHSKKKVKIACGGTLMDQMLAPKMSCICTSLSQYIFHFTELLHKEIFEGLNNSSLDFALLWSEEIPSHFSTKYLGSYEYQVYIPKKLLSDKKKKIEDLIQELPFVYIKHRGFLNEFINQNSKTNIVFVNENSQAYSLVESESYGAILPTLWGDKLDQKKFVKLHDRRLDKHARKITLAWNPQWKMLRGLENSLIDKLTQILKLK